MKEFNITGICIPSKHYMVDISNKLDKIIHLIDQGKYFTINRARQFGKTSTLKFLAKKLESVFLVLDISFEGLGEESFADSNSFCQTFINVISRKLALLNSDSLLQKWTQNQSEITSFSKLSEHITAFCKNSPKSVVLLIDEVDKSSNNQMFLHFIGMLRNKFLDREQNSDSTFQSVILAGVYDVKNLKLKLRPNEERQYNSPWNIATDFKVDMSFHPKEIETMLQDYENEHHTGMNKMEISDEIYKFSHGYPFLVSKIAKTIDEDLDQNWTINGVQQAVKMITKEKNTLFDDLTKNLENHPKFKDFIYSISMQNKEITYDVNNPLMELGTIFSIIRPNESGKVMIHNLIFEEVIYNYFIAERSIAEEVRPKFQANYIENGKLNFELIITKFQQFMYEEYRQKNEKFIEREGRLLFLCFLKPIINGLGYYYVESETRNLTRTDLIVTFNNEEFIVELKIWHGEQYESDGKVQLAKYLDSRRQDKGYLITFSFLKDKKIDKPKWIETDGKQIFEAII